MAFEIVNQPNQSLRYHGPLHILRDTAPFADAETRTSPWVACDSQAKVFGAAYSDQPGTLLVQFSADGVNVDHEETITVAAGSKTGGFVIDVVAPRVRLSYTNGAAPSSATRINLFGRSTS